MFSRPPLELREVPADNNLLPHESSVPNQGIVDSPWEAEKVRTNRKFGADLIKFCATGNVMSKILM